MADSKNMTQLVNLKIPWQTLGVTLFFSLGKVS